MKVQRTDELHILCGWTFFSFVHTQYVSPAESPVVCIAAYLLTSPGICAAPHFHAPCDEHFPGPGPGVTPQLIITRYLDIYCPLQLPRSTDRSLGVKHVQTMRCMIRGLLVTDTWHTWLLVQPASSAWRTQSVDWTIMQTTPSLLPFQARLYNMYTVNTGHNILSGKSLDELLT